MSKLLDRFRYFKQKGETFADGHQFQFMLQQAGDSVGRGGVNHSRPFTARDGE